MGIDGYDDVMKKLEEISQSAEEVDGEHQAPIVELFTPDFMQEHTEFSSFEEFFGESQWDVESQEDLAQIPEGEADDYVEEHTEFESVDEMQKAAWVNRINSQ